MVSTEGSWETLQISRFSLCGSLLSGPSSMSFSCLGLSRLSAPSPLPKGSARLCLGFPSLHCSLETLSRRYAVTIRGLTCFLSLRGHCAILPDVQCLENCSFVYVCVHIYVCVHSYTHVIVSFRRFLKLFSGTVNSQSQPFYSLGGKHKSSNELFETIESFVRPTCTEGQLAVVTGKRAAHVQNLGSAVTPPAWRWTSNGSLSVSGPQSLLPWT